MLLADAHRFIAFATEICCPGSATEPQSPSMRRWLDCGSGSVPVSATFPRARGDWSKASAENLAVCCRNCRRLHLPRPLVCSESSIWIPLSCHSLLERRALDPDKLPLIVLFSEDRSYTFMRLFRIGQRASDEAALSERDQAWWNAFVDPSAATTLLFPDSSSKENQE